MTSPFRQAAPRLREMGYSVVPLLERSKIIKMPEWSQYCDKYASEATFDHWLKMSDHYNNNIGVCLGSASGVVGVDLDKDIDGLHERITRILGESPIRKAGRQGYTAFYRYSNQRSFSRNLNGVHVIDFLSSGKQTVVPPSVHPEGMAYRWLTPQTFENTYSDKLPAIEDGQLLEVMNLFRGEPAREKRLDYNEVDYASADDVGKALQYISADDRDTWIRIGMALKDHFGESGYNIWDSWSATSPKYNGPKETAKIWFGFRGKGVTIASLFHEAMGNGFRNVQRSGSRSEILIAPGGNLDESAAQDEVKKKLPISPEFAIPAEVSAAEASSLNTPPLTAILNAPGLVGKVAEYINKTAQYEQPLLALAASLAFCGYLMGQKIRGPSDLRTNLYTLGIAHSGAGKDHARTVCKKLLAKIGLPELAAPASGASIKSNLLEQGGSGLMLIDEWGHYFGNISGKHSGSHQKEIASALMELFTSSNSNYFGKMYADTKLNPTRAVQQPCLCMYPVTTPRTFYGSLTSSEAGDGFLARILIFESLEFPIEEQENRLSYDEVPLDLLDELTRWKLHPKNNDPGSNMGEGHIFPATVFYDPEAAKLIKDYQRAGREKAAAEVAKDSPLSSVYNRVGEMAGKIALVGHNRPGLITADVMRWAISVAEHCAEFLCKLVASTIGENEHEAMMKRVTEIIRKLASKDGKAPHSAVVNKTPFLKKKDREEILSDLIASKIEKHFVEKLDKTPGPAQAYYTLI